MKIRFKRLRYIIQEVHNIDFTGGTYNRNVIPVFPDEIDIEDIELVEKGVVNIVLKSPPPGLMDAGRFIKLINVPKSFFEVIEDKNVS